MHHLRLLLSPGFSFLGPISSFAKAFEKISPIPILNGLDRRSSAHLETVCDESTDTSDITP